MSFSPTGTYAGNKLKNAIAYEDWIGEVDSDYAWREFDERTAAGLCYTSGTTGNPKGVLYSHRSNVLHSMMASSFESLMVTAYDSVMPIVPMFHANSWGLALSCPMRGSRMVMPGPRLDGASVYDLLETEKVTMTAAVPTVWLGLLHYLRKENKRLTTLKFVGIGGSACPPEIAAGFRGGLWHNGPPCLGHDGNEPGRLVRRGQAEHA